MIHSLPVIFFKAKENDEKILAWIFSLIIFVPTINYYLSFLLNANGFPTTTVPLYFGLYFFIILGYFFSVKKTLSPIVLLFIVLILYLLTFVFWPQNMEFMFGDKFDACYNPLYRIIFLGLPLAFIPFAINDYFQFERPLVLLSILNNIVGIVAFWGVVIGKQQAFEYMTFAYNLLFSSCFLFVYSQMRKSKALFIISIFSLFTLTFIGARGAMICALSFFVVYFFMKTQSSNIKKGLLCVFFFVVSILVYIYFNDMMGIIAKIMNYIGFDSRIVSFLLSSNFVESHGREILYDNLLNRVTESPVFGYGIFGDRLLNRDFVRITGYAHNIFLELMVDFGIFGGVILSCVYLFACLFFLIKSKKNDFIFGLYVAIFSSSFIKLLVTGSYLTEQYFYLLVGGFVLVYRHCYLPTKGVMIK